MDLPTYKELSEMHKVGSLERVLSDLENAELVDLNNALIKARRESADADAQWEKAYDRTEARKEARKEAGKIAEIKGQWTLEDWQRLAQVKKKRVEDLESEINRRPLLVRREEPRSQPVPTTSAPPAGELLESPSRRTPRWKRFQDVYAQRWTERVNRGMEKLDPVLKERLRASGEEKEPAAEKVGGSKRRRPKRTKHKMHRTKKRKLSKKRKSKKRRTKKKKKTRRRRR